MPSLKDESLALLQQMAGPDASFREHQFEAIEELVGNRGRVLMVERTGFGKSAVYFIATKLLREQGFGPTLLISPLLALMRNQVDMAERLGLNAGTINSSNREDWPAIQQAIHNDELDLLLISPERLNNRDFRRNELVALAETTGLLVIDEVHCISDWGHDFRPDYRRLGEVLSLLPGGIPILGTTATANDRVVTDVEEQLGHSTTFRGSLDRESLTLAVRTLPSEPERLAYLATRIPQFEGSGIVYCLTIQDTRIVSTWLQKQGIRAAAYSGETDIDERLQIEDDLIHNELKVVAATSALGMGFDKPDLGFVIHYQSPGNAIAYYQQVGRAGRALAEARGILLCGEEDRAIQDFFIETAFPPQDQAEKVIDLLTSEARPVSASEIMAKVNIRKSRLEAMLKILEVEGAVERATGGWLRTLSSWVYDTERVERVTAARRSEQEAMQEYAETKGCRMLFLRRQLDDPAAASCGRCDNCTGEVDDALFDSALVRAAQEHLKAIELDITPRKRWANIGVDEFRGGISPHLQLEPGRVLALYGDGGWGSLVRQGKTDDDHFSEDLVRASAELIRDRWAPTPFPEWITSVPSNRRSRLVQDFAEALASALEIPYRPLIMKVEDTAPQKEMENSAQQLRNIHKAFELSEQPPNEPALLVDDMIDSGWTLTLLGAMLRAAGVSFVYPFALARTTGK
jgi:ATP-dependent DNA helicase RecQ